MAVPAHSLGLVNRVTADKLGHDCWVWAELTTADVGAAFAVYLSVVD